MTSYSHEIETSPIPAFNLLELSDRQRTMFGSRELHTGAAHMVTPDDEQTLACMPFYGTARITNPNLDHITLANTISPRSSYQIPVSMQVPGTVHACNIVCRPSDPFYDFTNLRRAAVSETIFALQSQAENEQTRYYLPREAFWSLFKRHALRGWNAIFEKLESFTQLATGWDGYCARPPEKAAILSAKLFLSQLTESDRSPERIKPSVIGGIGITFKVNHRKCYVEFYNNGTVYALFSDGQTEPETCQVPPTAQNYKLLIKAIQGYLNAGNP
jgi:hypothetical protein